MNVECSRCANSTTNPTISVEKSGLCNICANYELHFRPTNLLEEIAVVNKLRLKSPRVMVGVSGGKDSTAALFQILELGFQPLAFTFDLGYYPKHIFKRSKEVCDNLGVPHEVIDIRSHIRPLDLECYKLTAELYDNCNSPELFRWLYEFSRSHYSVKSMQVMPFVRPCQLCRRTVIRAYYAEAVKRGVEVVFLGMNEWAGLSGQKFTAIRKLQPNPDDTPVYVVHFPFLFRRDLIRVDARIYGVGDLLEKLGWSLPKGERLVETNANSCLFARASEEKAKEMLGFHPDCPRLSREVTVGFLTKWHAEKALLKAHPSKLSVRQILEKAGILSA